MVWYGNVRYELVVWYRYTLLFDWKYSNWIVWVL